MTDDLMMAKGLTNYICIDFNWIIILKLFEIVWKTFDADNDSYLSMNEWVQGLSE